MNDLEMMTPECTQDTVVFSYWMNITPASHNSVFVGNVATWNHVQSHGFTHDWDKSGILFKWRGNRDQHIIYRMTVNVCE